MATRNHGRRVEWVGYLAGFGIVLLVAVAFLGLLVGVGSQITLFGEYESRVEATLYGPSILPCLVALLAAVAAAVTWRSAFLKERAPRSRVLPFLVVALGALMVGGVLIGPSERELETRWIEKLERLQLPAEFTPVVVDPVLTSRRYQASRHWATEQQPEQLCGALERVLESWLGSAPVDRFGNDGCYLSAVDENDLVSASFVSLGVGPSAQEVLEVRIQYAL